VRAVPAEERDVSKKNRDARLRTPDPKPAAGTAGSRDPGSAGVEEQPDVPGRPVPVEEPPAIENWEGEGGAPAGHPVVEAIDFKDRWLRAEAELQNVRRRAAREADLSRRAAEERVLLELVAALDDLERALQSAREAGASESWTTQGVALVAQRMLDSLARHGVSVEDPVGELFDPAFHEAILEVEPPADAEPGTVVQVVLKGYRRGERALRPAQVVVARHHEES
jgi:molecular chaperone GrpE